LVEKVLWVEDAFPGERHHNLPDGIISWRPAPQTLAAVSETLGRVEGNPYTGRTGNHRALGFFLPLTTDAGKLEVRKPEDFGPAVLEWFGV
jgi:hypothetical protein